MKRLGKIFINTLAVLMLVLCCFSFAACKEDITQIKLNISVYNYELNEEENEIGFEDVTLTVDLYGHFAPKTVSAILSYIKSGYYNNTAFYKLEAYNNQIMLGDYLVDGSVIKSQTQIMPKLNGEFEYGGTSGSNLVNKKGAIGLWRTWHAHDGGFDASNDGMHSGRATWYIPTATSDSTLSSYNDWFCIFAQIDLDNADNVNALSLIEKALASTSITQYEVYYTGEYDATQPDNNHGLEKHVVNKEDFELTEVTGIFEAKDNQEVCYNRHTINVPTVTVDEQVQIAAFIKSASVA